MKKTIHKSEEIFLSTKRRKRGIPLIRLFLLSILISIAWHYYGNKFTAAFLPSSVQSASLVPRIPETPIDEYRTALVHSVKKGDTFLGILSKLNIAPERAHEIYSTLKPLGLTLFPGDSLIVKTDSIGEVKNVSVLSRSLEWFQIKCDDSLIKAEKKSVQMSTYHCLVNGTLETSLSEDLNRMGVSDAITAKFADIFAWDINFFLDPRKGDSFQILFEEKFAEGKFVGCGEILAARYTCNGRDYYAIGLQDDDGILRYYDLEGKSVQKQFLKAPLRYSRISSRFSYHRLHPVLGIVRPHFGIDYAAPTGTPVYAAADGSVRSAGYNGGFGLCVIVGHGASYETTYGHLSRVFVKAGEHVRQGEEIGSVGATGLASGPHLDYRMKIGSHFVNPLTVSLPSAKGVDPSLAANYAQIKTACLAAFGNRFANQIGCHILEIEKAPAKEPVVNKVSRTVAPDGPKSNS